MDAAERLERDGYLILPDFIAPDLLAELSARVDDLFRLEGERAGSEFKQEPGARRLANLVDKGEVFSRVIAVPAILDLVARVVGPRFKLSSLNVRSAEPGAPPQPLHCDAAAIADEAGYWVCNTVWMLDDITAENSSIRIVPGSQGWRRLPQEVLEDPVAGHPAEIVLTGCAGTVVVMNTHAWHGAGPNRTQRARRALHAFYCRWDKPQQQYQKALLSRDVAERLSPELRALLALDDPLNDTLCATGAGASGFMK
jgi:ectoine hydroxylase-related dioxygenase (phytanoyl-CoA dioxygenase family)